jgi:hypothetical protein
LPEQYGFSLISSASIGLGTLTIPKKKSGEFNAQVASHEKSQR